MKNIYHEIKDARNDDESIFANAANREKGKDLEVTSDEFSQLESYYKCKVFDVIAYENINVYELFEYVVKKYFNIPSEQEREPTKKESGDGGCCLIE